MFNKVSEREFYNTIGNKDVTISIIEPYPYKVEFRERKSRFLIGYQDKDGTYYLKQNNKKEI